MAKSNTFRLNVPKTRPVEVYQVQLSDGSVVTRTLEQLEPGPKPATSDSNG